MKCAANEAYIAKKEERLTTEYGTAYLEYIDVTVSLEMIRQHGWGRKRLQRMYDSERQYVSDWAERYATDSGIKRTRRGIEKLTEAECVAETLATTQYMVDKKLAEIGFEYELAHTRAEDYKIGYRLRDQRRAVARMAWYAQAGGDAARLYATILMLYLHDEYGFGAVRLKRIWEPLLSAMEWYVVRFLRGTTSADEEIRKRLDDGHAEIERHGIELVTIPSEDRVEIRPKKDVPTEAVAQSAELAELSWEALRRKNERLDAAKINESRTKTKGK